MAAWRNLIFSGLTGACLFAGCTVTTGNGNFDGGVFDETGGISGTGGTAGTTGGSNTGGTAGPATTIVTCSSDYADPANAKCGDVPSACDPCLQKHNCTTAYTSCYVDSQCTGLISAMAQCMVDQFESGQTDPTVADAYCEASQAIMIAQPSTPAQTRAKALWDEIAASLDCTEVCCAVVTHH